MQEKITFSTIKDIVKNKKVLLWGASLFLENLLKQEKEVLSNIVGIIDNNIDKQNQDFYGYKIFSPEKINELDADYILITIADKTNDFYHNLIKEIKNKYPNFKILSKFFYSELFDLEQKIEFMNMDNLNAQIFNNLINNSTWVKRKDFIPIKWAANYSLLCILYIILDYFNPKNILELGMGQTTKLTSQYAQNKNKEALVQIIEHDEEWIKYFSSQFENSENVKTYKKDLETFTIYNSQNDRYSDLQDVIINNKYNLIIVDGPIGANKQYPRTNVVDLIPNNLAEDFIIILDDVNREGEKNTADLIFTTLEKNNIKYYTGYRNATKQQLIITSESCKFATIY